MRDTLRPRGLHWVFRSHAPLPVLLYLAAHDGRLLDDEMGGYALLAPPTSRPGRAKGARLVRAVDKGWDTLLALTLPLVLLLGAIVLLAFRGATVIALIALVACMALIAVLMAILVIRGMASLTAGRSRLVDTAVGQLRANEWTVTLLHSPNGADAAAALVVPGHDVGDGGRS